MRLTIHETGWGVITGHASLADQGEVPAESGDRFVYGGGSCHSAGVWSPQAAFRHGMAAVAAVLLGIGLAVQPQALEAAPRQVSEASAARQKAAGKVKAKSEKKARTSRSDKRKTCIIPTQRLNRIVAAAAARYGVPADRILRVIRAESSGDACAISPKGAVGLMQLMPGTARELGVRNRMDPVENVDGGTRYLKKKLKAMGGSLDLAAAAYNAGEGAVKKSLRKHGRIPNNGETPGYVAKVVGKKSGGH